MFTSTAYSLYIFISIIITVLVSRTLSKNGVIYLIDGFNGNDALARSVNHMLVVGFYLHNLSSVLLRMQNGRAIHSVEALIVYLSSGQGFILFALGIAHFFNMYIIHKFREGQLRKNQMMQQRVAQEVS